MKKKEKSAVAFIAFGLFIIFEIRKLPFGKFSDPGPGLFPLMLAMIVIGLSLISLIVSKVERVPGSFEKKGFLNVFYIVGILVFYRYSLPFLGYNLCTFFLLVFLLKIVGGQKWFYTIIWSVIITGASYLLFAKWLMVFFPKGVFPF